MKFILYRLVFLFRAIPLRLFFKRVLVDGLENIPKDQPVLFIANHTASFIDGGAVSFFTHTDAFPLARGDAFNRPIYNRMLRSLRILPIFRARDADPATAKAGNERTYEECYQLFKQGESVLIFPEASAEPEKTLRPLRKGAGNIAANALLRYKGNLDLYVVPIGINLSHFFRRRIVLQVGVGQPWSIQDHWDEIQADPRRFGAVITQAFEERLSDLTVKTEGQDHGNRELAHQILLNECEPNVGFVVHHTGADLIAARLDRMDEDVKELLREYRGLLQENRVDDRAVQGVPPRLFTMFLCVLTAWITLPATLLLQGLWKIADLWAQRSSPNPRFTDSIHLGIGFILTWFWYPLTALLLWLYLPENWHASWKIAAFILAILMAPSWQVCFDEIRKMAVDLRYRKLPLDIQERMAKLREQLLNVL